MESNCPLCHHSLPKKTMGSYSCPNPQCTYLQIHPVTYQNQVFNGPQSSKNQKSRCNQLEYQAQQSVLDFYLFKGCTQQINDCCHYFKYSQLIRQIATGIAGKAIQAFSDPIIKQQSEEQSVVGAKKRGKQMRVKTLASFSVFAACYQRQFISQQFKIAKYFDFSLKEWKQNVHRQNYALKQHVHDLPPIRCPIYTLKKVCKARGINQQQQDRMLQLCKKMQNNLFDQGKEFQAATVAAIAFWQIMQRTVTSQQEFHILYICASHEEIYQETSPIPFKNIEKYFDVNPAYLRKVFNTYFEKDFGAKYLNQQQNKAVKAGRKTKKNGKVGLFTSH